MLQIGSKTMTLQERVLKLFLKLRKLKIQHIAVWIPRDNPIMQIADMGSREFDIDNWTIDSPSFSSLNEKWGPFTVDIFASAENARLIKFYTQFPEVGSSGVNAFCQNLSGETVWATPPPRLITPAVKLLKRFKVTGVLCVPAWQASTFWTTLCPNGSHLARFVVDFVLFQPYFLAGRDMTNKTFQGVSKFKMLALQVDFSRVNSLLPHVDNYFKLT